MKHWPLTTLENVSEGIVDGPFGSNLKLSDYVETGIPVLQGKNITGNKFQWFDVRFISRKKAEELRRSEVRVGDHLLVKIGSIGYSAVLDNLEGFDFAIIPANLARIRPKTSVINSSFLHYVLTSPQTVEKFKSQASQTAQPALSLRTIKAMRIHVPPLAEQERIVKMLEEADELRKLRAQADRRTAALIPSLFHEMFGDLASNRKNWPMVRFAEIGQARLGKMLDAKQQTGKHKRPYLRNANVQWDRLELDNLFEMDFSETDREEFRLRLGDLLICEGGEVGRAAIWRDELHECYFQKALHRVRLHPSKAIPEFILHLLEAIAISNGFRNYVGSATISHLTGVKLASIRIPLPPLPLQKEFAALVSEICAMQAEQTTSRHRLDNLFQSMLHRAFNGTL